MTGAAEMAATAKDGRGGPWIEMKKWKCSRTAEMAATDGRCGHWIEMKYRNGSIPGRRYGVRSTCRGYEAVQRGMI
ncbi:hypothetical protein DPMN_136686 [Dreissena polymorpha]|uniref:Uncharacterized protein n=1 Tax=Dreissena polymorpha TaxID=45954 RepID=A0A9D4G423_DREPO|nr:hypothetical protein DPMN_136686 [Dreissena polymorpha]